MRRGVAAHVQYPEILSVKDTLMHNTAQRVAPLSRYFTTQCAYVYSTVSWEKRDARILKQDGTPAFEQCDVEFPTTWSQNATNIVASKYFRGQLGTPQRETSVHHMIRRVVDTITTWGARDGYFQSDPSHGESEASIFSDELTYILLHQYATFNSPVWFNVGVHEKPQCSACFILDVEDTMESILAWYQHEGMIFKGGSGSGINVSKLRGKDEPLSGGGKASGPLSFMKAADASAGVIKSGGVTRRAAKMVVMDVDHPDIEEFIWCKHREEEKARALIRAGYDAAIDGEAYASVFYQNANHSVGVTDVFMNAVKSVGLYTQRPRYGHGERPVDALTVFRHIAEATWRCGDPGLQYHDTMNAWHTTPARGPIVSSNPCSEFVRPPNEACNLASMNLLKFLRDDHTFDVEAFRHVVNVMITAMEILVSRSSYPTPEIERNSHDYRTLGLGYANLGALLMANGLPYDSDAGRNYAASVTALMTGQAYRRSAELAALHGAFAGFAENDAAMLAVIKMHRAFVYDLEPVANGYGDLKACALDAWDQAVRLGNVYGYRNAQVTLLAPTGTISFMMDCDTTGVEPAIALVSHKKLVGGGTVTHVNGVIRRSLESMGYGHASIGMIMDDLSHGYGIEACAELEESDLAVFDCAFPAKAGGRAISPEGHIRMVAAVQPFLSGSVSKTINLPNSATVEDIEAAYILGWDLGCKSLAVYRDGCKATQVLTTQREAKVEDVSGSDAVTKQTLADVLSNPIQFYALHATAEQELAASIAQTEVTEYASPQRKRLPDERPAVNHKATINGHELYLTVGLYDNGQPGEMFLTMAKEGSTISGLMDAFATAISIALQYGVPLKVLCDKFQNSRFEPCGFTGNKDIPIAKSLMDYIFRWLEKKFLSPDAGRMVTIPSAVPAAESRAKQLQQAPAWSLRSDAPLCAICGSLMTVSGACYRCDNCGGTSGCS